MENIKSVPHKRFSSIDRFRGFLILLMILFQCISKFDALGELTRLASHDPDVGFVILPNMTYFDIGAPAFLMLLAFTFLPSYRRYKENYGKEAAIKHFIVRDLEIIGVGAAIGGTNDLPGALEILSGKSPFDSVIDQSADIVLMFLFFITAALVILNGIALFIKNKDSKFKTTVREILKSVLIINAIIYVIFGVFAMVGNFSLGGSYKNWAVLPCIGLASLLMLCFAESSFKGRLLAGIMCLLVYGFVHEINVPRMQDSMQEILDIDVQGGVFATLSWGGLLILSTCLSDLFYEDMAKRENNETFKNRCKLLVSSLITLGVAIISYFLIMAIRGADVINNTIISKGSVSPTYILISLGLSGLILCFFTLFDKYEVKKVPLLTWYGRNAMLLYILEWFFNDIIPFAIDSSSLSLVPSIAYVVVVMGIVSVIASLLFKKGKSLKF